MAPFMNSSNVICLSLWIRKEQYHCLPLSIMIIQTFWHFPRVTVVGTPHFCSFHIISESCMRKGSAKCENGCQLWCTVNIQTELQAWQWVGSWQRERRHTCSLEWCLFPSKNGPASWFSCALRITSRMIFKLLEKYLSSIEYAFYF